MSEGELVRRAQQGDPSAIGALYQHHAARVFAVVRRLASDSETAEDWAQNAWLQAIRSLPRFRGDSQFGTWLHRIALNAALHGQRSERRRRDREEPVPDHLAASPATERDALLQDRLQQALDRLPDGMRRVLVLHDVEGYTHDEIAGMLGVAAGTCKSQLFKARVRMREMLRPETQRMTLEVGP